MKYFEKTAARTTTAQIRSAITDIKAILKTNPTPGVRKVLTNLQHELFKRIKI